MRKLSRRRSLSLRTAPAPLPAGPVREPGATPLRHRDALSGREGSPNAPEMPNRPSWCDRLGGCHDRIRIDPVVAIKLSHGPGLAEMLDAKRTHAVASDRPEPGKCRRVTVEHGDDAAMSWQIC